MGSCCEEACKHGQWLLECSEEECEESSLLICLMLEDVGLAGEMGRSRAYQCACRLGMRRPQLATLHALIHVAGD